MTEPLTYRETERLRQATWIVKHPMDYTDREIKRAGVLMRRLEAKDAACRAADAATRAANAAARAANGAGS